MSFSFGWVAPLAVRPIATTSSTLGASRHSRSTPWPTIPVAPKRRILMCVSSVGREGGNGSGGVDVGRTADLDPALIGFTTCLLGLTGVMGGVATQQQAHRRLGMRSEPEHHLGDASRVARLVAGITGKHVAQRADAGFVVGKEGRKAGARTACPVGTHAAGFDRRDMHA